ncbi:glycine zipper 2TM domain-containing protein [Frateuria aurantia]
MIKLIGMLAVGMGLSLPVLAQDMNGPPPPPPPPGADADADSGAHFAWADVLRVDPVYGAVQVPAQTCYNQTVVEQKPGHSGIGTVLGAVVGGVLGSTIGHGGGRSLATVAGAVGGGVAGNRLGAQSGGETQTTTTTCQQTMVNGQPVAVAPGQPAPPVGQQQIIGYDVQYRYHGDVYVSRLSYDPGERLRIRVNVGPAD